MFDYPCQMITTNKIARLTTSTSHQLEAEQVIPDLSSALKELVENSLDSNPSTISTPLNQVLSIKFFSNHIQQSWFQLHHCRR